jgi:hypothetical protein
MSTVSDVMRRHRVAFVAATAIVVVAVVVVVVLTRGGSKGKLAAGGPPSTGQHGQFVNANGKTVTFDRGKVSDITASSITVTHPDGSKVSLVLTPTTRYHPSGYQPKPGDTVEVRSQGATATAVRPSP